MGLRIDSVLQLNMDHAYHGSQVVISIEFREEGLLSLPVLIPSQNPKRKSNLILVININED